MERMQEDILSKHQKLKDLEQLKKYIKSGKEPKGALKEFAQEKGAPKTIESCDTKITKLKEQIAVKEHAAKHKEDNKMVSLGTSKINYMDPRISISWCKLKEVPIEKVFQKTLQSKFAWAMSNEPEWEF